MLRSIYWNKSSYRRLAAMLVVAAMTSGIGSSSSIAAKQTASGDAPALAGLWIDHTGRGAVDIQPCGKALCGRIVWMKNPNGKNGKPLTDKLNPSRAKQKQTICGLQVIGNVKRISSRIYDKGWIYDPEKGKSFDVELMLKSKDVLQVKGYAGLKFLNETYLWKRAPDGLTRCAN